MARNQPQSRGGFSGLAQRRAGAKPSPASRRPQRPQRRARPTTTKIRTRTRTSASSSGGGGAAGRLGGLALVTAAAGLAFRNRDKLRRMVGRRGASDAPEPVSPSMTPPAANTPPPAAI